MAILHKHGVCLLLTDTHAELLERMPELPDAAGRGHHTHVLKSQAKGRSTPKFLLQAWAVRGRCQRVMCLKLEQRLASD